MHEDLTQTPKILGSFVATQDLTHGLWLRDIF